MPYTTPLEQFDTTVTDGGLGIQVNTTNDRPPLGSFTFGPAYDGTCFILKDNRLYYCKTKRPEAWPELNYIELGAQQVPLETGVFHNGQPHVFSHDEIYYIQGTGGGVFQPIPLKAKTGAHSINGAVSVAGHGIFHTGPDGLYLYANGSDRKVTEGTLEPIFRGETVNGMPGMADLTTSWLHHYRSMLYFGYSSVNGNYPTNVFVLNLEDNKISYFCYNDGSDIVLRAITTDETNHRILVGDGSGFVRVIEDPDDTDDSGTAISWEVQSKDYTLATRKHFPRWVKYDIDASGATSATGTLLLDDSTHHTHTITGDRVTKRRLVGEGNGSRAAVKISGSGPATIYTAEFE
jgi:hypothetical protein